MQPIPRRRFLQSSAVLTAGALFVPGLSMAAPTTLRLGGPIFLKSDDPDALAREHRRLGYSAAYLPPFDLTDTARLEAVRNAYANQHVLIAEVGA